MSTRLLTHIRRKFSLFSSSTKGSKHSPLMYDDLNWHRSRHRPKKPHFNNHNNHHRDHPTTGSGSSQKRTIAPIKHQSTPLLGATHHDFDIVSFNLLAPVYKRLTTKNFAGRRDREASNNALWQDRLTRTMDFFKEEIYKDTAIIALQEYWLDDRYRDLFETEFRKHGYDYRIMQRAGTKVDAVALVIKTDVFDILGVENVDLCAMGDRVALLVWLRHKISGLDVLVANTHLTFPHHIFDRLNQVAQMKHLTSVIEWFSRTRQVTDAPVLIMGDFNVEGNSPVCDHLRSVGYYSCFEVCPPANSIVSPHPPSLLEEAVLSVEHQRATAEVFHGVEIGSKVLEYLPTTADLPLKSGKEGKKEKKGVRECDGGDSDKRVAASEVECEDIGDDCVPVDADEEVDDLADGDGNTEECTKAHSTANTDIKLTASDEGSRHEHLILPTSQRRVTYVSHFNHRSEQVGVDHIFIKPNLSTSIEGINDDDGEDNWDKLERPIGVTTQEAVPAYLRMKGANSAVSNVNNVSKSEQNSSSNSANRETSVNASIPSTSSDINVDSAEDVVDCSNDSTSRVYVAECQVLPTALHCTTWSPEFVISDHRPVRTKIVFTKKVV